MGRGRRGPGERVEAGGSGRNTIRRREVRLLSDRATGGRQIAGDDGRAISVEKHPTRSVRAKNLHRIRCTTYEDAPASGCHVHGGDAKSPYRGGVAPGLSRRGKGQTAIGS